MYVNKQQKFSVNSNKLEQFQQFEPQSQTTLPNSLNAETLIPHCLLHAVRTSQSTYHCVKSWRKRVTEYHLVCGTKMLATIKLMEFPYKSSQIPLKNRSCLFVYW